MIYIAAFTSENAIVKKLGLRPDRVATLAE
jgi:hypothetical protein